MSDPCSMQSMPASMAARMPSSPWAWRGHLEPGPVRFVDDGPQLLVGVLLGARRAGVRHHATRGADLDHLCAVLDLVAHRLADLADAVGDPLLDGQLHDVRREGLEHGRVEVAAGRRDGVPGRHDPRPVDPAEVDGLLQGHVEQQAAGLDEQAEVAHRGEAGPQRAAGVGHGPQRPHGRVVLDGGQRAAVVGPPEEEVDLHVHQAREQRQVTEVDDGRAVRHVARLDLEDAVTLDQQVARGDELALDHVEHAGTAHLGVGGRLGRGMVCSSRTAELQPG